MEEAGRPPWANSNSEEAARRPPWANSNSEDEEAPAPIPFEELLKTEEGLFQTRIVNIVTERISKDTRNYKETLNYVLTLWYEPTNTTHECILTVTVPTKENYLDVNKRIQFKISKINTAKSCIEMKLSGFDAFSPTESSIKQNSRTLPRCFHPAVPAIPGAMTDFLQILSTKIKYQFNDLPQIIDAAEVPKKDLPLFTFRFMRLHPEPSIYQKYGYELINPGYWQGLRTRLGTLTPKKLMEESPNEEVRNALKALQEVLKEAYNEDKPLPALLKDISYEVDDTGEISLPLFHSLHVDESYPWLQLNPESEKWKLAERKLIITNIRAKLSGENISHYPTEGGGGAAGGAGATATGGARRHRKTRSRSHRKKRATRRRKLDGRARA